MTMRRVWTTAVLAALVVATGACGDDGDKAADKAENAARQAATTVANKVEGATRLSATLSGSNEVPGPGDTDGTGTATVNVDVSKTQVCYEVRVQRLDHPTAMHIHQAEAGKAGDVVVPLTPPTSGDGTASGCANADAPLLGRLVATPSNFYVNVHTDAFPQGAIRGQLSQ